MENVKSTTMRLVFTCVALLAAATASAQEPPELTAPVNDFAHVIDPGSAAVS